MNESPGNRVAVGVAAMIVATSLAACGGSAPPSDNKATADELAVTWVKAFNAGDAAAVAALYTEDAHSMPPDGAAITGRSAIESYWRHDIGPGGVVTKLTPGDSVAQGDLLHVDGAYEVAAKDGVTLGKGQYQQLWRRTDGQWRVQHEIWRLDPSRQREPQTADRLASLWTTAYNTGNAEALAALYGEDAELSTHPSGSVVGRNAIGSFWKQDFGEGKPTTKLSLTDVYMSGEIAHLEGQYEVSDKGKVVNGRYVQLWLQDGNAWRIHREMWWQQ